MVSARPAWPRLDSNRYARFEYVHAEKELSVVVDEEGKKERNDDDDDDEGGGKERKERVGKIVESGDCARES